MHRTSFAWRHKQPIYFFKSQWACPISQVLVPILTTRISQVLDPAVPVYPVYHKYWSLSYRFIPYITSTGPCSNCTSPKSKLLAPALSIHPICHMYLSLSYRYIPNITSTGPCPTSISRKPKNWTLSYGYIPYMTSTCPCPIVTSTISQVLVPVLPVYPLYHKSCDWILSYRYIS